MDEDTPQQEPEKPRFLLPDGCKDLIDALPLQQQQQQAEAAAVSGPNMSTAANDTPQPLPANVALPDPVIVRDLASALHLKPFQIVGALMEFDVFVTFNTALDFHTASALCSHSGVVATKVG